MASLVLLSAHTPVIPAAPIFVGGSPPTDSVADKIA